MSLFKSIGKLVKKAAPVIGTTAGMVLGGPSGAAFGGQIGSAIQSTSGSARPGLGFVAGGASMAALPPLIRGATMAGGYAVRGYRAVAASATYYCRKYPTWCSTIGGLAAVEAMVGQGQLPTIKRRRRRGITPKDLASFRRVANLVKCYAGPARRMSTCKPKRACRT